MPVNCRAVGEPLKSQKIELMFADLFRVTNGSSGFQGNVSLVR